MRTIAVLVATSLIAVGLSHAAVLVVGEPEQSEAQTTGLVWGGRVFTEKDDFAAWLAARNVRYETWLERHPGAAPWDPAPRPAGPAGATSAANASWRDRGRPVLEAIMPASRAIASLGLLWPLTVAALLVLAFAVRLAPRRLALEPSLRLDRPTARAGDALLAAASRIRPPAARLVRAIARGGARRRPAGGTPTPRTRPFARPYVPALPALRLPRWSPPRLSLALPPLHVPEGLLARGRSAQERERELAPPLETAADAQEEPAPEVARVLELDAERQMSAPAAAPVPLPAAQPEEEGEPQASEPPAEPLLASARQREETQPSPPAPPSASPLTFDDEVEQPAGRAAPRGDADGATARARPRARRRRRKRSAARTVVCEIELWQGYVKAQLFAAVRGSDGEYAAASSPMFWRRGLADGPTEAAQLALAVLEDELLAAGWEPDGHREAWYARRFRKAADVAGR